jgi:hypothetical protein
VLLFSPFASVEFDENRKRRAELAGAEATLKQDSLNSRANGPK